MTFVLRMTARELRSSWKRLLFFFICIAIGVAAIVALRSVIQSVRNTLAGEARSIIAADATITSSQPFTPEMAAKVAEKVKAAGATTVRSTELATMARAASRPGARARIVELRAVEPGFPFYGELKLTGGQKFDHGLLSGFGVLVKPELLAQLDVKVGDTITLGTQPFTIRGLIESEPGRQLGGFSIGPRVFADLADLQKTNLLGFGARSTTQLLLKVPEGALDDLVTDLRKDFVNDFARVRSWKGVEDDMGRNFERAENYLSLVGLVVVVLGGIGVSSVTRVFVQQKLKSIAVLKCLGSRSIQLLAVYVTQMLLLGMAGSVLGVGLAWVMIRALPSFIPSTITIQITYGLTWPAISQGLGIGTLVSLLFSLVPLLDIRHVKPSLLLRDEPHQRRPDLIQIVVTILVIAGLGGLTVWQAGNWRVGGVVAGGFLVIAVVLNFAGLLLLRLLRPLANTSSFALRHAVLQLSRPGSQMRIVLMAVGLGSFFIVGVRSLQENLVSEFRLNLSKDSPDLFLIDVQRDQEPAVQAVLAKYAKAGAPPARLLPVLRARVTAVAGRDVQLDNYQDVRGKGWLAREFTVTYRPALEPNEKVTAGAMWGEGPSANGEVSIEESFSNQFKIGVGDDISFDVLGRAIKARVTSVRHVEWSDSRAGGFVFVFRPGVLESAPHTLVGFARGPDEAERRIQLQSDLVAAAPNLTVIDGREIFKSIQSTIDNVTIAVTVVGGLVVVSGLLILIGAVAMTKFRRVYEAAIFKTLGATRRLIASVLVIEYGLLGLLAGSVGSLGAIGLTWAVSRYALDIPFKPLLGLSAASIALTSALVAIIGVIASWEVLQRKPLATLRAE
jgi:putative ABC transport system permease protein